MQRSSDRWPFRLAALLLLCSTGSAAADGPRPPAGSYGFDWLAPATARCAPITAERIARFKACTHAAQGGFDGQTETYTCRVDRRSEFVIFRDRATCDAQFGIMEANAP